MRQAARRRRREVRQSAAASGPSCGFEAPSHRLTPCRRGRPLPRHTAIQTVHVRGREGHTSVSQPAVREPGAQRSTNGWSASQCTISSERVAKPCSGVRSTTGSRPRRSSWALTSSTPHEEQRQDELRHITAPLRWSTSFRCRIGASSKSSSHQLECSTPSTSRNSTPSTSRNSTLCAGARVQSSVYTWRELALAHPPSACSRRRGGHPTAAVIGRGGFRDVLGPHICTYKTPAACTRCLGVCQTRHNSLQLSGVFG